MANGNVLTAVVNGIIMGVIAITQTMAAAITDNATKSDRPIDAMIDEIVIGTIVPIVV